MGERKQVLEGRCIALRQAGQEGWQIGVSLCTAAEAAVAAGAEEVREIALCVVRGDQTSESLGESRLAWMAAEKMGWMRDEIIDCWRAPGEACARPGGTPERAEEVRWAFWNPLHGWMAVHVGSGGGETQISASDVYDPFEDFVDWLEAVCEGRDASMQVDEEGRWHDLHAFGIDGEQDRVRFHVVRHREDSEVVVDASVPRVELVGAAYSALRSLDGLPEEARGHWGCWEDDDEIGVRVRRSPRVENFLRESGRALDDHLFE